MKHLQLLTLIVIAMGSLFSTAHAGNPVGTKCYVYLVAPCYNYPKSIKPQTYVLDWDVLAQVNATRCAQRAAEFYNWCGDPNGRQVVYSAFNVTTPNGGEMNVQSTAKYKSGSHIAGPNSAIAISLGQ